MATNRFATTEHESTREICVPQKVTIPLRSACKAHSRFEFPLAPSTGHLFVGHNLLIYLLVHLRVACGFNLQEMAIFQDQVQKGLRFTVFIF